MTFYKIITNGAVTDAGTIWLTWNAKHHCLMACEPNNAVYAQGRDLRSDRKGGFLQQQSEEMAGTGKRESSGKTGSWLHISGAVSG